MKTPLEVLNEYNLSDFLMTTLKRNSTKDPLIKLNPLFVTEGLPYNNIYKAESIFPQEFHKQVKQIAERRKIKKSGNYHELLVLPEREKRKFLIKGTEVG